MKKLQFSYNGPVLLCYFNYFQISIQFFSWFSFHHFRIEKFCALEAVNRISLAICCISVFSNMLYSPFLRKIYLVEFYNYFSVREKALYFWDFKTTLGNLEMMFLINELLLTLTITLISKLFSYSYKRFVFIIDPIT